MIECIDNDDKRIFKKFQTLKKCSKLIWSSWDFFVKNQIIFENF